MNEIKSVIHKMLFWEKQAFNFFFICCMSLHKYLLSDAQQLMQTSDKRSNPFS